MTIGPSENNFEYRLKKVVPQSAAVSSGEVMFESGVQTGIERQQKSREQSTRKWQLATCLMTLVACSSFVWAMQTGTPDSLDNSVAHESTKPQDENRVANTPRRELSEDSLISRRVAWNDDPFTDSRTSRTGWFSLQIEFRAIEQIQLRNREIRNQINDDGILTRVLFEPAPRLSYRDSLDSLLQEQGL